jgi:hypothetical protein
MKPAGLPALLSGPNSQYSQWVEARLQSPSFLFNECPMQALDGRDQDEDLIAVQVRVGFVDGALGKIVD